MKFDLEVVLTISSGKLICPIGSVYSILSFMTGEDIYTHQIPRAMKQCRPWLLQQHPTLADADLSALNKIRAHDSTDDERWEAVAACIRDNTAKFGSEVDVKPLPMRDELPPDPLQELIGMVGAERVVVVTGHPGTEDGGRR